MKRLALGCSGLLFAALALAAAAETALTQTPAAAPAAAGAEPSVTWESNTCVYVQGEWTLRVQYLQKGTRSEGQDGALLKNGQAVQPPTDSDTLVTALGQLKHYGTQRNVLWAVTGWNFADKKLIKLSGQVKTSPAPAPK